MGARISAQSPTDTIWNAAILPSIRAAIEWKRNQPLKAIELLQSAAPYDRTSVLPVYGRGMAYLQAKRGPEAAAEFQKILDHRAAYWGGVGYPLSYVGLARAAVMSGDPARAKKAYQDFLAFWKDAEADLPVLQEARKEYEALR